jgi:hypothetical protein
MQMAASSSANGLIVAMDFTTEESLQEAQLILHDGAEVLAPKQLETCIYTSDAKQMYRFFECKYRETAEIWKSKEIFVPEFLPCMVWL